MAFRARIRQFHPEREDLPVPAALTATFFPSGKMNESKITNTDDLGARIRARRVELRLTQVELADVARVTPRLVGELERGKSTAHLGGVMRTLAALGLDIYLRTR